MGKIRGWWISYGAIAVIQMRGGNLSLKEIWRSIHFWLDYEGRFVENLKYVNFPVALDEVWCLKVKEKLLMKKESRPGVWRWRDYRAEELLNSYLDWSVWCRKCGLKVRPERYWEKLVDGQACQNFNLSDRKEGSTCFWADDPKLQWDLYFYNV